MNTDLDSIIQKIIRFRDDRDWKQYHDPKNLSQAISIEVAELQEIFLWKTTEESKCLTLEEIEHLKEELADIFIFMTYMCHEFKIDIFESVKNKLRINADKYPIVKSKGNNKKYTVL